MARSRASKAMSTGSRIVALVVTAMTFMGPSCAVDAHHGYGAHYYGPSVGFRVSRGYYGGHHGHGSSVSVAWSGPLYVAPRRPVTYAVQPAVVVQQASRVPRALPDMPSLEYQALRDQDRQQTTLDRRRCEREAWRTTRPDPTAGSVQEQRSVRYVQSRYYPGAPSPLPAAANGAILGAVGGAIGGDAGLGAAIGAAVGATSWLLGGLQATTVRVPQEVVYRRYVPPPGPDANALRASLMACMEARGYAVR